MLLENAQNEWSRIEVNEIKVTDYISTILARKGVRQVFELSGGMITHLLDSLNRLAKIQVISVHHEQAAAFAADAVGRMTGIPGVAAATSGPGATNLLTGIGSCYFDSSPAVFITGQVNRNEQKGDRKIRQLGFQETDIVSIARPITKEAIKINSPEEIPLALDRAFAIATEGRPGPVLIDIPMDVQRCTLDDSVLNQQFHEPGNAGHSAPDLQPFRDALLRAERPVILVGGGIRASRSIEVFRKAVELLGIPVVQSLMALDTLPYSHGLRVGMIGSYGNRWANLALSRSDLILVLGSRLDVRQTGSQTDLFTAGRTIFHVDCEEGEINNRLKDCVPIVAELSAFLPHLLKLAEEIRARVRGLWGGWLEEIGQLRNAWPDTAELDCNQTINPNLFMHELSAKSAAAGAYVVDVGQHQMWAAQSLELHAEQRFLTSGGMGSMGFALPASIGAALSVTGKPIVLIAGDGAFQCNIQELQTIVRLGLPIKLVVINNGCHGMVRQFQESYFESRYQSTYWGYSAPDFAKISSAYGICSMTVDTPGQTGAALRWLWERPEEPRLLQVMVDTFTNTYPKIAFGRPIGEMEPFSKPTEIEST